MTSDYATLDPDLWRPCGSQRPHRAHTHEGLSGYACLGLPGPLEHPSLKKMREQEAEAIAQGYTEGDVNHFIQPLIGRLRRLERDAEPLAVDDLAYFIEQMHMACNAERAWLHQSRTRTEASGS